MTTDNPTDHVVTDAMIEAGISELQRLNNPFYFDGRKTVGAIYLAMSQASPPVSDEVLFSIAQRLTPNPCRSVSETAGVIRAALTACRMGGDDE